MSRRLTLAVSVALVPAGLSWSTDTSAEPLPPEPSDASGGLSVYTGVVDARGLAAIVALGVDRHELKLAPVACADGEVVVEVIVSGQQAADLAAAGADLARKDKDEARARAGAGDG